jgi:hypothetical protein
MPLMQALKKSQIGPGIQLPKKLPLPVLSNLLWAAWGINRPDGQNK